VCAYQIHDAVWRVIPKEHQHVVLIHLSGAALEKNPKTDGGLLNKNHIEKCECKGGKLAELETSEENAFIKGELLTRSARGKLMSYKYFVLHNLQFQTGCGHYF
ncbi:Hypothetical predicted protein, partial [Mytilus galloprovincialis]